MHSSSVASFKGTNVLVVGDLMLDTYYWGTVKRMSPEAPVPIVSVNKIDRRLGGAGNVIANLKSLEAIPSIVSVIGKDNTSEHILALLQQDNVETKYILSSDKRVSTEKIRVINQTEHVVRCDIETEDEINEDEAQILLENVKTCIDKNDIKVIILQDYNKGVLSKSLIQSIIQLAKQKNIPVTVDPKKKNFFCYTEVNLFKPNLKEVREALDIEVNPLSIESLKAAAKNLFERLACQNVFITLSEHGAFYMNQNGAHAIIHAHERNIVDVSGAGDTVISVASLCVANAFPIEDIASISNLAGGIVCEESGVVSLTLQSLQHHMKEL